MSFSITQIAMSLVFFCSPCWAVSSDLFEGAPQNWLERIDYFSGTFLEKPYQLNPLGEGSFDAIDGDPLYRMNAFDCITYLETVLALANSQNLEKFQQQMISLRYSDRPISFENRNHFVEAGWLAHVQGLGLSQDKTAELFPQNFRIKKTDLQISAWLKNLDARKIGKSVLSSKERKNRLAALALKTGSTPAEITYLPKFEILRNPTLLDRIPPGSLIFFVASPFPEVRRQMGTDLLVNHAGIYLRSGNKMVLRNASSRANYRKVVEEDLFDMIRSPTRMPTLDGIHVEVLSRR